MTQCFLLLFFTWCVSNRWVRGPGLFSVRCTSGCWASCCFSFQKWQCKKWACQSSGERAFSLALGYNLGWWCHVLKLDYSPMPVTAQVLVGGIEECLAVCVPFPFNGWAIVGLDSARRFTSWITLNYGQGRRGRKEFGLQLGFFYNSEIFKVSQEGCKYYSCELQWFCSRCFTDSSCCLFHVEMFTLQFFWPLATRLVCSLKPSLFLQQTT